jgi:hypothetical protein
MPAGSRGLGRYRYWLFALTLIPLTFSLLGEGESLRSRIEKTIASQPAIVEGLRQDKSKVDAAEHFFSLLPEDKIAGAHLARSSSIHWMYAILAAAAFLGLLTVLFEPGKARLYQAPLIGLCTATFGLLFLISLQWIAAVTQGWIIYGRSIIVLLFYVVKFIGFSYRAAMDPENGFLLSFLGFTFGVGSARS